MGQMKNLIQNTKQSSTTIVTTAKILMCHPTKTYSSQMDIHPKHQVVVEAMHYDTIIMRIVQQLQEDIHHIWIEELTNMFPLLQQQHHQEVHHYLRIVSTIIDLHLQLQQFHQSQPKKGMWQKLVLTLFGRFSEM